MFGPIPCHHSSFVVAVPEKFGFARVGGTSITGAPLSIHPGIFAQDVGSCIKPAPVAISGRRKGSHNSQFGSFVPAIQGVQEPCPPPLSSQNSG